MIEARVVFLSLAFVAFLVGHPEQGNLDLASLEKVAIEQTVGDYFNGVAHQDLASKKRAFHPDAKMMYIDKGALVEVTQGEWYERTKSSTLPEANYRKIISLDVAGNAAAVKSETDFAGFQFIDYLSLLKIDGQWKIVGKIFFRKEKK